MRHQIVTTLDAMTDCLLVGHNDYDFKAFTEAVEDKLDSPSDRNLKPERPEALEKVSQF